MARRVPLTKLVELDADVRPYLASLMVAALDKAGKELIIPAEMKYKPIAREVFEAMLAQKAGESYHHYGDISQQLLGKQAQPSTDPAAQDQMHRDRLEGKLDAVTKSIG